MAQYESNVSVSPFANRRLTGAAGPGVIVIVFREIVEVVVESQNILLNRIKFALTSDVLRDPYVFVMAVEYSSIVDTSGPKYVLKRIESTWVSVAVTVFVYRGYVLTIGADTVSDPI